MSQPFRLRNSGSPPEPERNEKGIPVITKAYLRRQCEDQEQYATPHLNTRLFLASKGFQKVESLEEYINVRALYLNNNVLHSVGGLASLKQLRCLFLQGNFLTRIEGLEGLIHLETLNLSQNQISEIDGLADLHMLSNLDLSHNKLTEDSGFARLAANANLTTLNLAANSIDKEEERVLGELRELAGLKVVYLKQNGIVSSIKNYRKRLIHELESLVYLDERPVTADERKLASGFILGGKEGEQKAREAIQAERERSHKAYLFEIREARAKFQKHKTADLEKFKDQIDKENQKNANEKARLEAEEGEEDEKQLRLDQLDREMAADALQIEALEVKIAESKVPLPVEPAEETREDLPFETVPTDSDVPPQDLECLD